MLSLCEGNAMGYSYLCEWKALSFCEGKTIGYSSVSVHLLVYFYQSHVLRVLTSASLNLACWLAVGTADPSSNY
jgi:hypothetical protein